jgi:hypothetical protein
MKKTRLCFSIEETEFSYSLKITAMLCFSCVVDCFVVLCFDSTNLLGDLWIWVVSWVYTGCVSPLCWPCSLLVGMFDGPIMGIWGLDRMTVCVVFQ